MDASGNFSLTASTVVEQASEIQAIIDADESTWDWDEVATLASELFGQNITAAELQEIGVTQRVN